MKSSLIEGKNTSHTQSHIMNTTDQSQFQNPGVDFRDLTNFRINKKPTIFDRLYSQAHKKQQNEVQALEDENLTKMKADFERVKLQNKMHDKDSRKFRMHDFIFQKKKQNELKYDDNSKLNQFAMPVPKGTVSIMLNTQKKNYTFGVNSSKKKVSKKSKFKMKWKTIQWLMNNKRDSINQLLRHSQSLYVKFGKGMSRNFRLNKKEFSD